MIMILYNNFSLIHIYLLLLRLQLSNNKNIEFLKIENELNDTNS